MAIRARFFVAEVTRRAYGGGQPYGEVVMQAVTRKTDDNVDWAQSTPAGRFSMNVNGPAMEVFDGLLGKDVSITIDEIPAEPGPTQQARA